MKNKLKIFLVLVVMQTGLQSQTINLNESYIQNNFRLAQLNGDFDSSVSFTVLPLHIGRGGVSFDKSILGGDDYGSEILSFWKDRGLVKVLPVDWNLEFTSHHPFSRNNGAMIPNKGFQQLISAGIYAEIGPLSVQFKPEYVYAENAPFDGFPESHYDVIWQRRYYLWNRIDMPERFGEKSFNKINWGQSSIRLNWKSLSLGLSTENIWWGPGIRNSIMMSNQAQGMPHITFNSRKPLMTPIGSFEWQFATGRQEPSGFSPPGTDRKSQGQMVYVPKKEGDWVYFQGFNFVYSPKWTPGLSLGIIKWNNTYYETIEQSKSYFPVFGNLLTSGDKIQGNNALGGFFRWLWSDANTEVYGEFYSNDSKANFRDLLLDTDHSRAFNLGLQKVFKSKRNSKVDYLFSWEWTSLGQSGSRVLRNASSWYLHFTERHGYTNYGEVMGAAIGPGSNAQYFGLKRVEGTTQYGVSFEIVQQDNDFLYYAFEDSKDFRRYWKDFNFGLNYQKKFKNLWLSSELIYSRSLNYQWELVENVNLPYYQPGTDVNNIYIGAKLMYQIPF